MLILRSSGIRWSIQVASHFAEKRRYSAIPLAYSITAQSIHRPFKDCVTSFQSCAARCDSLLVRYPGKFTRYCQLHSYTAFCQIPAQSCKIFSLISCAACQTSGFEYLYDRHPPLVTGVFGPWFVSGTSMRAAEHAEHATCRVPTGLSKVNFRARGMRRPRWETEKRGMKKSKRGAAVKLLGVSAPLLKPGPPLQRPSQRSACRASWS